MATFGMDASPFVSKFFKPGWEWRVFLLINNPFVERKLLTRQPWGGNLEKKPVDRY